MTSTFGDLGSAVVIIFIFSNKLTNHVNKIYNLSNRIRSILSLFSGYKNWKSGKNKFHRVKRNVSANMKKYVASKQKWKCNKCKNLLDAHNVSLTARNRNQNGNKTTCGWYVKRQNI